MLVKCKYVYFKLSSVLRTLDVWRCDPFTGCDVMNNIQSATNLSKPFVFLHCGHFLQYAVINAKTSRSG